MPLIALKAHFDGQQIQLDQAFDIPANTNSIVTIALSDERDAEFRRHWSALAKQSLSRVYGDEESEYRPEDCK